MRPAFTNAYGFWPSQTLTPETKLISAEAKETGSAETVIMIDETAIQSAEIVTKEKAVCETSTTLSQIDPKVSARRRGDHWEPEERRNGEVSFTNLSWTTKLTKKK